MKNTTTSLISVMLLAALAVAPVAADDPATGDEAEPIKNTLRWTTASEVDNFGFDIYRGTAEEGPFERITERPIPGAGTVDEPTDYVYDDLAIDEGVAYYYYVESISTDGVRERFSPVFRAPPKHRGE
jgi:hypothetical protein